MDRGDLQQVLEIERACFSAPWTEAMFASELYNDAASLIVAESAEGVLLGYALLRVVLDEGTLEKIAVAQKARRTGAAQTMLTAFLRFGYANLAFITLEVRQSNRAAIALYEKLGFQEVGRRKNYYTAPVEDALLMTAEFPHSDGV